VHRVGKVAVACLAVGALALGGAGLYTYVHHKASGPQRYDASSPATSPPGVAEAQKAAVAFLRD
jgi:hypothetical protein